METILPSLQGKVCLVTGATSGIGAVTARVLAQQGATVVIVGRNPDKCDTTVSEIRTQTGNRMITALVAELSSQKQVRELARQFLDRHPRLDVLVNNAGGLWLRRQLTVDGLEMTFAVNHLAYFLLTRLLLDGLKASAPARIVNVSSGAHRKAAIDFEDLMGERHFAGWAAYCRSKLANLLFTYELARQLQGKGVTANALHPGWVATGFGGSNGWRGRLLQHVAGWLAISPEEGAQTVLHLAASPEVESVTGRYFVRQQAVPSSAASYDAEAGRRLWELSMELTENTATMPRKEKRTDANPD